jgi:hypothetical protein
MLIRWRVNWENLPSVTHGLNGVVLISFTNERVQVNSCGNPHLWLRAMRQLAERLFADIDDGKYDPTVDLQ